MRARAAGRRFLAVTAVACTLLGTLASCAPAGRAVGDTTDAVPAIGHDGADLSDIVVGVVGSRDRVADVAVIDALSRDGIAAVYASPSVVPGGGEAAGGETGDAEATGDAGGSDGGGVNGAVASVEDFTTRGVSLIMICRADMGDSQTGWRDALVKARDAGIPVALVEPRSTPADDTWYAAVVDIAANASGTRDSHDSHDQSAAAERTPASGALDDVVFDLVNDRPHKRRVTVDLDK
ncbi:hypothetical protein [Bifidobacterium jacchi]|uniref:Sugar ABC transporter substrate-binding protein n=1 Tax=Bifidobacterium jacchi TaxID=2490545 RepID=A0A5N5RF09_9BIFI|nr:hypothetical protein [Bifidobacterium jacchi]KAB5605836.1 hypothetical protein EHS19_08570 [Bifidobacterium jacchi]